MEFTGGLTLITHSIILFLKWIIQRPLQFLIVFVVFGLTILSTVIILRGSFGINNNYSFLKNFNRCDNVTSIAAGNKYVILRIDDIQAHSFREVSMKMINDGLDRGMTFTLGVIPLGLTDDEVIVDYLSNNSCNFEIALHGWNHRRDVPEFDGLSELAAQSKIRQGKEILERIIDESIVTFIPPNNVYSEGTFLALKKEGFSVVSSEGDSYFDYSAATYNFSTSELNPVDLVLNDCKKDMKRKDFCIIMLHPQDYTNNDGKLSQEKYAKYLKLLDELEKEQFAFTTMRKYFSSLRQKSSSLILLHYEDKLEKNNLVILD